MIQIRSGVFETNSSSTHSIAIPRDCRPSNYISFNDDEFGWGFSQVDPADYFYTAIHETSETMEEIEDKLARLKYILNDYGIEYHFGDTNCEEHNGWLEHKGYIDHGYELRDFVNDLLDNGDKLVRFLSGGLVFAGNDNSESYGFLERNSEFIENYDWRLNKWYRTKNDYYMENCDDYEWYSKGN
jgi:hypothetical protein